MAPWAQRRSVLRRRRGLALGEGAVALGAIGGAVALVSGSIDFGRSIDNRLPFESPVFGAVALFLVVAVPMVVAAVSNWRGSRHADLVAIAAGVLLMGWIVVEVAVIRSFSVLQPVFLLAGWAIAFAGYRGWHLTWGATEDEVTGAMPGDDLPAPGMFSATRAITIDAPVAAVWPWLVQVGVGRAGFYSYDALDNRGRQSARVVLDAFQNPCVGDVAAPMTEEPSPRTSFVVGSLDTGRSLVWAKDDAVWAWLLVPEGQGTRLVTRLRTGPIWHRPLDALIGGVLLELGDFPMMRKMLLGIRERAESSGTTVPGYGVAA